MLHLIFDDEFGAMGCIFTCYASRHGLNEYVYILSTNKL
jgi:hypothetical protein